MADTTDHGPVPVAACPFCNSDNVENDHTIPWWVTCHDCGADGPTADTEEEAADAWNAAHAFADEAHDILSAAVPDGGDLLDLARRIVAERAELLATLANERGEGEPPSEGWEWDGVSWSISTDDGAVVDVVRLPAGWRVYKSGAPDESVYPTARAAMRAADATPTAEVPRG